MRSRELHAHIKGEIERELRGRSWNWLAEASGVPQSTLADQAARPKFSLDVLVRVAATLHRRPADLLPLGGDDVAPHPARDLIRRIQSVLEDYTEGRGA